MHAIRALLGVMLLVAAAGPLQAQQFPSRPITLVVPYAAGGNVDISTRILQAAIGNGLGQPIVIENRTGAGGTIAGEYVARAAPDGHTLFVGSNGPVMFAPMTMAKPPYQWDKVFAPVSSLAFATNMLLVRPTLPVKTLAELIAYSRQNPGKLTLATSGGVSINHFLAELLKLKTGITWTEVHYRGNAPAIADLIAGHVDVGFQQLTDSLEHVKAGRPRALAVLGPHRADALPDVPSSSEAGYPEVQGITFNGIFAPQATPPAIVGKLSTAIRTALQSPDVKQKLADLGSETGGSTPEAFAEFLRGESAKWTELIQKANIKGTE